MRPILFKCPVTTFNVQHLVDDCERQTDADQYEPIECPACSGLHYVNARTGKVLGEE